MKQNKHLVLSNIIMTSVQCSIPCSKALHLQYYGYMYYIVKDSLICLEFKAWLLCVAVTYKGQVHPLEELENHCRTETFPRTGD